MKPKGIMLSEISQMEKAKYYMISLTCGRLKKKTHIVLEIALMVTTGEGGRGRVKVIKGHTCMMMCGN